MEIGFLLSIHILLSCILKSLNTYINFEILSLIFIVINSIVMPIYILRRTSDKKLSCVVTLGLAIRIIVLIIDLYFFRIPPHSGMDSEAFHGEAMKIYNNIDYIGIAQRGMYSKFIGIIYLLIGPQRPFVQYLNTILGIMVILQVVDILKCLKVEKKIINYSIVVLSFFPHNIMFSAILLREMIVAYCITTSMKYIIYWSKQGNIKYYIRSITILLIGCIFHSGIAPMLIAYVLAFSLYDIQHKHLNISLKGIILLLGLSIIGIYCMDKFSAIFLLKFERFEDIKSMFDFMNVERGGSSYLSNFQISSFSQLILFTPIKMIYFLFSPMPWDIRSVIYLIVFICDSSVYLYILNYIYKNYKYIQNNEDVSIAPILILGLILTIILFSYGTSNIGTAIRHRNKLFYIILILFSVIKNCKNNRLERNEEYIYNNKLSK